LSLSPLLSSLLPLLPTTIRHTLSLSLSLLIELCPSYVQQPSVNFVFISYHLLSELSMTLLLSSLSSTHQPSSPLAAESSQSLQINIMRFAVSSLSISISPVSAYIMVILLAVHFAPAVESAVVTQVAAESIQSQGLF
jgi:hypothetical protein